MSTLHALQLASIVMSITSLVINCFTIRNLRRIRRANQEIARLRAEREAHYREVTG